jgi:hypothetical protein
MTHESMALLELMEKNADADLVREMLAFAAERIMEAEVEAVTGAAKGARRLIPKLRKGSYLPSFLEPQQTAEKAPSSRRPVFTGSRRGRSTSWCAPWARAACPRDRGPLRPRPPAPQDRHSAHRDAPYPENHPLAASVSAD